MSRHRGQDRIQALHKGEPLRGFNPGETAREGRAEVGCKLSDQEAPVAHSFFHSRSP